MTNLKYAAALASVAAAFPGLFSSHAKRRKEQAAKEAWSMTKNEARTAMERKAHNDAIDAKKAAKRAAREADKTRFGR